MKKYEKGHYTELLEKHDDEFLYLDGEELGQKIGDLDKMLDGLNNFFKSDKMKKPLKAKPE